MNPIYVCYYQSKKSFFNKNPKLRVKHLEATREKEALAEAKWLAAQAEWEGYTILRTFSERIFSTLDEEALNSDGQKAGR